MVLYYNFTQFSGGEGFIGFYQSLNELVPAYSGFLLFLCFGVSYIYLVNKSKREGDILDTNDAIHYSMLFTTLMAVIFYVAQILTTPAYIYICAVVYLATAAMRFYHRT